MRFIIISLISIFVFTGCIQPLETKTYEVTLTNGTKDTLQAAYVKANNDYLIFNHTDKTSVALYKETDVKSFKTISLQEY